MSYSREQQQFDEIYFEYYSKVRELSDFEKQKLIVGIWEKIILDSKGDTLSKVASIEAKEGAPKLLASLTKVGLPKKTMTKK